MTRRLHTVIPVLLGAALVAPAFAGMLYVPIAVNTTDGDVTSRTELWVTNPSDSDLAGFFATFIPALADGTVREGEPPSYFVAPGESVRFGDLVPQGAVGMLEIEGSPGLVVSARLVSEVTGFADGRSLPSSRCSARATFCRRAAPPGSRASSAPTTTASRTSASSIWAIRR